MLAFRVYGEPQDLEEPSEVLVFAHNEAEAIKTGIRWIDECEFDDGIVAIRHEMADKLLKENTVEPYGEFRDVVLRQAGFKIPGEDYCEHCEMAACDIDEFSVCYECQRCTPCANADGGCDWDKCENKAVKRKS